MAFTVNQEEAIKLNNKNILVSAAAGSGKTSVLVERIIRKITDEKNPIPIDRLLIMTFTNAAAKEMRDRIREAIDKRLDENPDNDNLINQSVLIHNATITTIHGFCQSVIRDHFEEIGVDPNFRVGDENECKLIRNDAMDSVLESFYEEGDNDFLETVECLSGAKSDTAFSDLIHRLYLFSQSSPNPEEYLNNCIDNYRYNSFDEFKNSELIASYTQNIREQVRKLSLLAEMCLEKIEANPQLSKLKATIESDLTVFDRIIEANGYEEMRSEAIKTAFVRMASVQDKTLDDEGKSDKTFVSDTRAIYKKSMEKIKSDLSLSMEKVYENMTKSIPRIETIVKVIAAFKAEYQARKADKGIIDFNDMEHMAIQILSGSEEIARSYREHFEEIYVDEYQDSNMTQETLLEKICRKDTGNLFMVGDVKQSIYRFRQARPDLFLDKYNKYYDATPGIIPSSNAPTGNIPSGITPSSNAPTGNIPSGITPSSNAPTGNIPSGITPTRNIAQGNVLVNNNLPCNNTSCDNHTGNAQVNSNSSCGNPSGNNSPDNIPQDNTPSETTNTNVKIILNDNFRSRREVLDAVNEVFSKIMTKEAGGIEYDEAASLKYGAVYYDEETSATPANKIYPEKVTNSYNDICLAIEYKPSDDNTQNDISSQANQTAPETNNNQNQESGQTLFNENTIHTTSTSPYKAELIVGIGNELPKTEFQAAIIADKITQMMKSGYKVYDTKTRKLRPIRFSDIVILVRSIKGWEDPLKRVLADNGIPVSVTSSEGYFNTIEVRNALAFLKVIDNPQADVPFATLALSEIGDFTNEELAVIRALHEEGSLYDAVVHARTINNANPSISSPVDPCGDQTLKLQPSTIHKCEALIRKIEYYREKSSYTPVHKLVEEFVDKEYGDYALSMARGEQRYANLNMLIQKAVDYGKTSFKGLFNFVRYMDLIKKYEIEDGEAGILGENDNVVRIMTIHKSKGLEFPVCFVAGMEKKRNDGDEKGDIIWDVKLGIGVNYVDLNRRIKSPTLYRSIVRDELAKENIAEEMRVLYVAMTRAREKLIMVASSKDEAIFDTKKSNPLDAASYLDMLGIAASSDINGLKSIDIKLITAEEIIHEAVEEELTIDNSRDEILGLIRLGSSENPRISFECDETHTSSNPIDELHKEEHQIEAESQIVITQPRENVTNTTEISIQSSEGQNPETILQSNTLNIPSPVDSRLRGILTYQYPYIDPNPLPLKLSVSELKHRAIEEKQLLGEELVPDGERLFKETEPDSYIPKFMRQEGENQKGGTFYGSAFHRILELWDYSKEEVSDSDIEEYVAKMQSLNQMDRESANAVRPRDIAYFLNSDIGRRMYKAKQSGQLYREQPFSIGVPKSEIESNSLSVTIAEISSKMTANQIKTKADPSKAETNPSNSDADDIILVQGIIDAFIVEDDGIAILDYKTDYVKDANMLINRYRPQLEYYGRALSQVMGMKIKELIIYSSRLRKTIVL